MLNAVGDRALSSTFPLPPTTSLLRIGTYPSARLTKWRAAIATTSLRSSPLRRLVKLGNSIDV